MSKKHGSTEYDIPFRLISRFGSMAYKGAAEAAKIGIPLAAKTIGSVLGLLNSSTQTRRSDGTIVTKETQNGVFSNTKTINVEGKCWDCDGSGKWKNGKPCRKCNGTGRYSKTIFKSI